MQIAVIGAGVSGLVACRVLKSLGHQVEVFEKAADIGGVWSASRRYPGLTTQDDRVSYSFADSPMPADYALHPPGALVQSYLERYAFDHALLDCIRFSCEVENAIALDGEGWLLTVRGPGGSIRRHFDFLIACPGTYSDSHVPDWPGRDAFETAGGRIIEPSSLGNGEAVLGRSVVTVGWGKTACDIATATSVIAASSTVIARELRWKYPKQIGRRLTFRHLVLTRLGEHLVAAPHRTVMGFLTALITRLPRMLLWSMLASIVSRQLGLKGLGLQPRVVFADSNSLVTDGFYDAVESGRLAVVRDVHVSGLGVVDSEPAVWLSDGTSRRADIVIPATGYDQNLGFLSDTSRLKLVESDGDLLLYRKILPTTVERLAFIGWTQSYRSPLTAEVQALWLAGLLAGDVRLPALDRQRAKAERYRLTHARASAANAPQLPSGSFGELDILLEDLQLALPASTRLKQLTIPLDPSDYAYVLPALLARHPALAKVPSGVPV